MNTYDALATTPHDRTVGSLDCQVGAPKMRTSTKMHKLHKAHIGLDPAPAWMQAYLKPWGHDPGLENICVNSLECGVVSKFGSLQNPMF